MVSYMTKHSTTVKVLRIPGLPRITGFRVECTCGKEFQPHSSLDNQGYAMHAANAERDAHRTMHYQETMSMNENTCPRCGADVRTGSPADSDIVVVECTECEYEDAF